MSDTTTAPVELTEAEAATGSKAAAGSRSETAYPYYPLEEAMKLAEAVQRVAGNMEATDDAVMEQLGLTSKTARAWTYRLSSAREFGLISRSGRADTTRIALTDVARRCLKPADMSGDRDAALVRALSAPKLYAALIEQYMGAPLPSTQVLGRVMVERHKILASVSEQAAQSFIDSARFAGIVDGTGRVRIPDGPARQADPAPEPVEPASAPAEPKPVAPANPGSQAVNVPADFILHNFQLRRKMAPIVVPLPQDLRKKDIARLHAWLDILPTEDEEEDEP